LLQGVCRFWRMRFEILCCGLGLSSVGCFCFLLEVEMACCLAHLLLGVCVGWHVFCFGFVCVCCLVVQFAAVVLGGVG
jgi:hypothetical protein